MIQYADDITLMLSDKTSIDSRVSGALDDLKEWFSCRDLRMNKDKTQLLRFSYGMNFKTEAFQCRDSTITSSGSLRMMGVTVDYRLSWVEHIDLVAKNMSRYIYGLRTLSKLVDVDAAILAYHAYVSM
ncbi:hypothetical protein HHI36_012872 [Cryptolaemus montrouzieri]|uniref:Reverse transcriptase domain-containing protein n=1 Tax=Cryptolaemus montrouzieri TaxID=559131 RepID=A0ABD2NGL6_9CUCU